MKRPTNSSWRSACGLYTVHVSSKSLDCMARMAVATLPSEVGTSLVGSYSDDGFVARVEELAPLPSDSRGSWSAFHRGVLGMTNYFTKLFADSSGKRYYVGEWHSHPDGSPHPSGTDDAALHAICRDARTKCPEVVLVLLGGSIRHLPSIGVYVYSRTRGRVTLVRLPDQTATTS